MARTLLVVVPEPRYCHAAGDEPDGGAVCRFEVATTARATKDLEKLEELVAFVVGGAAELRMV